MKQGQKDELSQWEAINRQIDPVPEGEEELLDDGLLLDEDEQDEDLLDLDVKVLEGEGEGLDDIDLGFLGEEVDKETDKKGQSSRMRTVQNYPQGYFVVTCDFEGMFEVKRLTYDAYLGRKHEPMVFDNWSKLRQVYINSCRRKRKELIQTMKKIENLHVSWKEEEK